jgi:hypothetical protein
MDKMKCFPFSRWSSHETQTVESLDYPYVKLGPLRSHIFPHYAIVSAAQKLMAHALSFLRPAVAILGEQASINLEETIKLFEDLQSLWQKWTADSEESEELDARDGVYEDDDDNTEPPTSGVPRERSFHRHMRSHKLGGAKGSGPVDNMGNSGETRQPAVASSTPGLNPDGSLTEGTSDDEGLVSWSSSGPSTSPHAPARNDSPLDDEHPHLDLRALPGENDRQWRGTRCGATRSALPR